MGALDDPNVFTITSAATIYVLVHRKNLSLFEKKSDDCFTAKEEPGKNIFINNLPVLEIFFVD